MGLNGDNLRKVRKQKGAPKWVRELSKMVETMANISAEEVPMVVIVQEICDVIMELDKDSGRLLKDAAKNRKQREMEKKKKGQGEKAGQDGAKTPETGKTKNGQAGRQGLVRRIQLVQRLLGHHKFGLIEPLLLRHRQCIRQGQEK